MLIQPLPAHHVPGVSGQRYLRDCGSLCHPAFRLTPDCIFSRFPPSPKSDVVVPAQGATPLNQAPNYMMTCPSGAFVTALNVRASDVIYGLGPLACSDGSTLASVGSSSDGNVAGIASAAGFASLGLTFDSVGIDQISVGESVTFGTLVGMPASLQCAEGTLLAGLFGESKPDYVASIGLVCRPCE